jgi:hypothetical protein
MIFVLEISLYSREIINLKMGKLDLAGFRFNVNTRKF